MLDELIGDPKLRAVLLAQRANYGGMTPSRSSFGIHAMVMHHYFNGGYYPIGGAEVFANSLIPVIERAGGTIKLRAGVRELLVEDGHVAGTRLEDGTEIRAPRVFSDAGARNTVGMLPSAMRESEWAREILSLAPSVCHFGLYLGLEGDIRANGASPSNHWIYESWNTEAGVWKDSVGETEAPGLFVSFPSLKDPTHDAGNAKRHTCEIVATTCWDIFAQWRDSTHRNRPEAYRVLKAAIEAKLMTQFARHFPALAPMVVARELSTPLTTSSFIGSQQGAMYGLEVSPRRSVRLGKGRESAFLPADDARPPA